MTRHHLAQFNIARLLHPLGHPAIQPFVDGLETINGLAENSPGFIWRLKDADATSTERLTAGNPWADDPLMLLNLSVWESPDALKSFVYRSDHVAFFRRRTEFFEHSRDPQAVLWWIPAGHQPNLVEGRDRLAELRAHGPSPRAFWYNKLFPAPSDSERVA